MSGVCEDLFYLPLQSAISAADMRVLRQVENSGSNEPSAPAEQPVFWSQFVGDHQNERLKCLADPKSFQADFWPLVLYGEGSNGKTSIAMAFASRFANEIGIQPDFERAADFIRRHRDAIQTETVNDFRKRYYNAELLVFDDIQLLKGRASVQSEFIKLLDLFAIRKKPLIVTINELPEVSNVLIPQLASRLSSGLVLPVNRPGPLARREISTMLAKRFDVSLSPCAVDFIADHCDFAVPRMTLLFSRLHQSSSAERSLSGKDVKRILFGDKKHYDRDVKILVDIVTKHFELSPAEIRGKSRKQTTVLARGICIFLCRDLLQLSFAKIGECFGGRDHSTIIHAYNNINQSATDDPSFAGNITELRRQLTNQFMMVHDYG